MLVDVDVPLEITDPLLIALAEFDAGGVQTVTRLQEGVYLTPLNHHLDQGLTFEQKYPDFPPESELYAFGVCDTVEQFMTTFGKELIADRRPLFVTFTVIEKADQEPEGGWRWHKWGPYLGEKRPKHEYLYDEGPEFERVFVFHVHNQGGSK